MSCSVFTVHFQQMSTYFAIDAFSEDLGEKGTF